MKFWLISSISIVAFFFIIGGGLDKFEKPVIIVLPADYRGLLCIELTDGGDSAEQLDIYYADSRGRLAMNAEVSRSHRRRLIFWNAAGDYPQRQVSDELWNPILTEQHKSDQNKYYAVYWVGTSHEWSDFSKVSLGNSLCS